MLLGNSISYQYQVYSCERGFKVDLHDMYQEVRR